MHKTLGGIFLIFGKRLTALCVLASVCMGTAGVNAAPVVTDKIDTMVTSEYFAMRLGEVYMALCGEVYIADSIGTPDITKQDAAALIYEMLLSYDSSLAIDENEAEIILNKCYDNGKLNPENRIPFAFCLKHGIYKWDIETYPSDMITGQTAEIILGRVEKSFIRDKIFYIGEKKIVINGNVSDVIESFGNPSRIDKTIYGFEWYVYHTDDGFFMLGVRGGRICAFFSNDDGYDVLGYKKGSENTFTDIPGLYIYTGEDGTVDGVLYNPNEIETTTYSEEHLIAMENELLDIINAHRGDTGKLSLNKIDAVNSINEFSESAGQNVFELFYGMIMQKAENPDIINETVNTTADVAIDVAITEDGGLRAAVATNSNVFGILPMNTGETDETSDEKEIEKPDKIVAPEITSISNGEVVGADEDITIELDKPASDRYYIKIYDVEADKEVVCQYITSVDTKFVYPKALFTPGSDYIIEMCSINGDELLYADFIEFTYGEAANPVCIEAPFGGSYTYDSEIEVFLSSSVYHDFKLEVINSDGESIISTVIRDSDKAVLDSIPSGKYTLSATALMRGTNAERGQHSIDFEVKKVVAQVKEYTLKPDEIFNFTYESKDGQYIYFYDEEIIYINEEITETVTKTDENGIEITETVTKTVPSPRKHIIQKKVPATKQYRKLRAMYKAGSYTTGAIPTANATETGNAIANKALLYQGIPYVWGGETTSGFDCSGLVKYVCNKLGINVHRTSREQFAYDGVFVEKSQLIPGDLLFFQDNGVIHHVGIYIGDGKMVHAPHTGDVVKVSSINSDYYKREYAGAKRVY